MNIMRHYKIKHRSNIVAHAYMFLQGYDGKDIVNKIMKDVPVFRDTGYGGLKSKDALRTLVSWDIFGKGDKVEKMPDFKPVTERKIMSIIEKTFLECYKVVPCPGVVKIFVFPTIDPFVKNRMSGTTGVSFWKNSINIFISTDAKEWEKALSHTVCHEYSHATRHNYVSCRTLIDWIILDGIAEHFREDVVGGTRAPWSSALTEKEAKKILIKLKHKLSSRSIKLHGEVFYVGKKYPHWAGYSIGYYIVKNYLVNTRNTDWPRIFRTPPKEILQKSNFLDN